jgi:site-specific recombinase XerD
MLAEKASEVNDHSSGGIAMRLLKEPMSPLRRKMIEDLQLKDMSVRTREMYMRAAFQLAMHYNQSFNFITEEQLRQYFLHLLNVKHDSPSAFKIALCGIKFFYVHTLKRSWPTLEFIKPPRDNKLPVVLSQEEVRTIVSKVRLLRYRVCVSTIYSCGLRLQERTFLEVQKGGRP